MLSFLLLKQIAQLFIILLMGWVAVKSGLLHGEDSLGLSKILLYIVSPCVIIKAFQLERTPETSQMLLLSFGIAIFINLALVVLTMVVKRPFHLTPVEQASVILPNCTNLIIPLVAALFGDAWVVYISTYGMIQVALGFTYGRCLISGEKRVSLKSVFLNANVIAIFAGLFMFLFQIKLPPLVQGAVVQTASIIGPAAMLLMGMLMASVDFKMAKTFAKVWRVVLLRLVVMPVILVLMLKYSGVANWAPNGDRILLISLLSASAPVANLVMQFCQFYERDAEYASFANVVSLLLCIVTMPLIVALYQL